MEPETPPPPTTVGAFMASLFTFAFSFLGAGALLLFGWLQEIADWVASSDESVVFPSMAPLAKVAVAFLAALVIAGLNFLYRWAQTNSKLKDIPGFGFAAPTYLKVETLDGLQRREHPSAAPPPTPRE